jgi:hypothetical protein
MAVYTLKQPYTDNWSKNPVEFTLRTSSALSSEKLLGFSLLIQNYITEEWETVYTGTQQFNTNSESYIDVSSLCDVYLEYFVAKPWDKTVVVTNYVISKKQARNFRMAFWETDDKDATTILSDTFYVVKGGVSKEQANLPEVYSHFFTDPVKPLTYSSNIYRDQGMFFVSYYIPYGMTATTLQINVFDEVPNVLFYSISDAPVQGDVITFFIDVSTLVTDTYKLVFTLVDSGSPVSEALTCPVITRRYVHSKIFTYINSLGGTDVVYLPYNQMRQSEQARTMLSRLPQQQNVPYMLEVGYENFQANQLEELTTSVDSGELSQAATDALRDMALAPYRYEVEWGAQVKTQLSYIPVNITSKKNVVLNRRNLQPLPMYFEITRAVSNYQYTPGNNNCDGRLTSSAWAGLTTPVEDYYYMLLESETDMTGIFSIQINKKVFIDYGDNESEVISSNTTHTYANTNFRKVTLGTLMQQSNPNLYVVADGKVTRLYGNLPRLMPNFKFNNQQLTTCPKLPVTVINLEIENNLLTLVPTLPPNAASAKLTGNEIEDFETTSIPDSMLYLDLSNNKLPVSIVNYILSTLDTNGLSNGLVKLDGQTPAAAPTGAGATAASSLTGKGWIVNTD